MPSSKTDLTTLLNYQALIYFYFKGRLSSELNLIFIKSFLYSHDLSFIFSIRYLIFFHSSVYFVNISLLLSLETKVKYLFPLLSSVYPSTL